MIVIVALLAFELHFQSLDLFLQLLGQCVAFVDFAHELVDALFSLKKLLLRLSQQFSDLARVLVALSQHVLQTLNLSLERPDSAFIPLDHIVLLSNHLIFRSNNLQMLLNCLFQIRDLLLQRLDSGVIVSNRPRQHFLSLVFLLLPRSQSNFFTLLLPLLNQLSLLKIKVFLHFFLGVELVREQVVILLICFLHMISNLFLVLLLKCLDRLIVLFEFFKLLFEFLAPIVKPFLQIHNFHLHCLYFLFVLALKCSGFIINQLAVTFKSLLALLTFSLVLSFELADFLFPTGAVLGSGKCVFLLCDDLVRSD